VDSITILTPMTLLKTLKTNWRDIVSAGAIVIAVAFVADIIERLSVTEDGLVWLSSVVNTLQGLAAFAGANLAGWFMLSVAWPSLNIFGNDSYDDAWDSLSRIHKFNVFVGVSCVELVAAAICFS
jgi:hypothetical protein